VLIITFAIRYRRSRRPMADETSTSHKLELIWTVIPLVVSLGLFAWGAVVYFRMHTAPPHAMEIYVVGKRWMWKALHPGGRREINELHVPVRRPIKLILVSEDVIHSFYVPAFRTKADALPNRYTTLWFEATRSGQFHLFCAEYCGTNHSKMIGRIVVLEPADYQRWLAGKLNAPPIAEQGHSVFQRLRCDSCHEPRNGVRVGPSLAGRFGKRAALINGSTAPFDENYIRESILDPKNKIAQGFQPVMPTYRGQISESDLVALIDYLKQAGDATARMP
jgi:cytochrome c oxidase subunit 2